MASAVRMKDNLPLHSAVRFEQGIRPSSDNPVPQPGLSLAAGTPQNIADWPCCPAKAKS